MMMLSDLFPLGLPIADSLTDRRSAMYYGLL
jgi:hypothetical protein